MNTTFPHFDGTFIQTGPGQIAGYIINFQAGAYDPSGKVHGATPEQVATHNDNLSRAELEADKEQGAGLFFLVKENGRWAVSKWTGSWRSGSVYVREGRHNIARRQYAVTFTGPDGKQWHGRVIGYNTQAMHAKRSKNTR